MTCTSCILVSTNDTKNITENETPFRKTQVNNIVIPLKGRTAIPLQGWRGPEGSRRLRRSDFKTIGT